MESKDELKDIDIKNRMCYYFDDIIRDLDIEFDNVLLDENSYNNKYKNISIYDISCKAFMDAKSLHIRIK